MTDTENTTTLGGHRTVQAGVANGMPAGDRALFRCLDCDATATVVSFSVGTDGCPARPESLNGLAVCPGGERCQGHMIKESPEFRAYAASSSAPIESVPRRTCTVNDLAARASAQYLYFADKIGMKMGVWASQAKRVGAEGGVVAEFQHANGLGYVVLVDQFGKITAERDDK